MLKEKAEILENYILAERPKKNDEKLKELKLNLLNEFKNNFDTFYVGNLKNNVFEEYNDSLDISDYDFIIPINDKKLIAMINKMNDFSGMEAGFNNYKKLIQATYNKIYELNGFILNFF